MLVASADNDMVLAVFFGILHDGGSNFASAQHDFVDVAGTRLFGVGSRGVEYLLHLIILPSIDYRTADTTSRDVHRAD